MGKWAKDEFGLGKVGKIGIIVAGNISSNMEKKVLSYFDEILCTGDHVYHTHIVKKNRKRYFIAFNVYGAPAILDLLTLMYDGGCRTVIFMGSAYGFKDLDIGSYTIPNKAYHFEGFYSIFDPSKTLSIPDKDLIKKVKQILDKNKMKYSEGPNISVPAVTFQLPHANERYKKIKPLSLEMELAACFSRCKEIGIRTAGILWISDSKKKSISKITKKQKLAKKKIIKTIINHLNYFNLPPLKVKRKFNIDKHLASIIEDPDDVVNVYKKKKR